MKERTRCPKCKADDPCRPGTSKGLFGKSVFVRCARCKTNYKVNYRLSEVFK